MPRHNPDTTPPEKRRLEKGARAGRQTVHHSVQSFADLEALAKRWGCSETEAVRRALRESASAGE